MRKILGNIWEEWNKCFFYCTRKSSLYMVKNILYSAHIFFSFEMTIFLRCNWHSSNLNSIIISLRSHYDIESFEMTKRWENPCMKKENFSSRIFLKEYNNVKKKLKLQLWSIFCNILNVFTTITWKLYRNFFKIKCFFYNTEYRHFLRETGECMLILIQQKIPELASSIEVNSIKWRFLFISRRI